MSRYDPLEKKFRKSPDIYNLKKHPAFVLRSVASGSRNRRIADDASRLHFQKTVGEVLIGTGAANGSTAASSDTSKAKHWHGFLKINF